ncbi:MAG TPA: ATP-dependent DNA ligase [Polyangiaceae bacterium]|nr:ATP-dependent DNA ligase [Polyangiaceae bacterium]
MLLADLVQTSRAVTETRARSKKIELLAACLERMSGEERAVGVAFLMGELRQGKIGLGYAAVRDLGPLRTAERGELALLDVDRAFSEVAAISGAGSGRARAERLASLFERATAEEQQFLKRLIVGELRQGALEGVLVEAVARAARVSSSSVRRALMLAGDLRGVAEVALRDGEAGLARYRLELFRPLSPMLADAAPSLEETFAPGDPLALEYKLDGARVQVHRSGSDVRVFTRNNNDVTARVPEVVQAALAFPAKKLVLDGEVLALDPAGKPRAFQTTMRRFGRRALEPSLVAELPVKPFFFDVLHADGEDVLDRAESERWAVLEKTVPPHERVERLVARAAPEADEFLGRSLAAGHEGIMAKSLTAPYEAGRRGASWLKVKPVHTLDLVVLAVEWGSGRRQGFLSNLHLGARDPEHGSFVMLGKTFKGMTDAMLAWQTEKLLSLEISRDAYTVYVRPELVVEIAFDGVQASSQYPGGLALRFARVKRYREDKSAAEASTMAEVRALHRAETVHVPGG